MQQIQTCTACTGGVVTIIAHGIATRYRCAVCRGLGYITTCWLNAS